MKHAVANRAILFCIYILIAALFLTEGFATVIYVGPSETYTTINAGIGATVDGDTVIVRDGSYDETVMVDKSIMLQAEHQHLAIIGGPGSTSGFLVLDADSIVIDSLKIDSYVNGPPGLAILNGTSGHIIKNNYVTDDDNFGIGTAGSGSYSDITIENNVIENCGESGLEIAGEDGFIIQSNTMQNNGGRGILIWDGTGALIDDNTIYNNDGDGIEVEQSGELRNIISISNNSITYNGNAGIMLRGAAIIQGNTIENNDAEGIATTEGVSGIQITNNNEINDNGTNGIMIEGNSSATISDNTINENGGNGIQAYGSVTLSSNLVYMNNANGLYLTGSATANNDTITNNGINGVEIEGSATSISISNCDISSNSAFGVFTRAPASIQGNIIDANIQSGICVHEFTNNVIISSNNQITDNVEHGILINQNASATVQNNTITGNCTIVTGYEDYSGIQIEGSATVEGNTISNNLGSGIKVADTSPGATIRNNPAIDNNREGLHIYSSATVENNTFDGNQDEGIFLGGSANNVTVAGNTMTNNTNGLSVWYGATNITVRYNDISSNANGLKPRAGITLRRNSIESNSDTGVQIYDSSIDIGQNSDAEAGMNTIMNNSSWNAENFTGGAVSAYRNYWGSTTSGVIDGAIYDDDEDGSRGPVNFEPFLSEDPNATIALTGTVVSDTLKLSWVPTPGNVEYWVYGAEDLPYFSPGFSPGYEYRLAVLSGLSMSWDTIYGIGDDTANWTYMIIAVDAGETEVARSNRIGEFDFQ